MNIFEKARITVEQAKESKTCRLCLRPILSQGVDDMAWDPDAGIVTRNGTEFAHASCLMAERVAESEVEHDA